MDDIAYDRRNANRQELRTRVHLFNEDIRSYENAHFRDISSSGMYLFTRRKLSLHQTIQIVVPCDPGEDTIKLKGQVVRIGHHRSWGLFSYGCTLNY